MLRKVRYSIAAVCLIASVLLAACWCRSEKWPRFLFLQNSHDVYVTPFSENVHLAAVSKEGTLKLYWFTAPPILTLEPLYGRLLDTPDNCTWFFENRSDGHSTIPLAIPTIGAFLLFVALAPSWVTAACLALLNGTKRIPRRISVGGILVLMTIAAGAMFLILEFLKK
jgi:hypothetical protein